MPGGGRVAEGPGILRDFRLWVLTWLRARTRHIVRFQATHSGAANIHTLLVCVTTAAASFFMVWSIPAALDRTCEKGGAEGHVRGEWRCLGRRVRGLVILDDLDRLGATFDLD
eukprot:scaffold46249_cov62-Phaeocystis_antarctica.AAC.1